MVAIEARLDALDQQIRVTQRLAELEREKAIDEAKVAPRVTAGRDGFSLQSGDKAFQLKLRGYTQADGRFYTSERSAGMADTFVMRRVRPVLEGTLFGNVDFRIMPDFGEGRTVLAGRLRRPPVHPGAEASRRQVQEPLRPRAPRVGLDLLFVDRALPTALVPNRDVGVMLFGDLAASTVSYALGVFNGVPDGGSADIDDSPGKDVVARVFLLPLKNSRTSRLQQLGFGLAASLGERRARVASPGLPTFRTTSQQTFARYRTDGANTAIADGRIGASLRRASSTSPPSAPSASTSSARRRCVRVPPGTRSENRAWQLSTSYVLTGEPASSASSRDARWIRRAAAGVRSR